MKPPKLLAAGAVLVFVVVALLPLVLMMTSPFWADSSPEATANAFFESRHLSLARNSLGLGFGATGLSLLFGVPMAFLLCKTAFPGQSLFRWLAFVPILIPPYIHAIIWNHLNALIKDFLMLDVHTLYGGAWVLSLAYYPFVVLTTMSGMKSVDRNAEEASLLCRGRWQTIHRITLPLTLPHIYAGAVLVFIFCIIDFGVPDILRINVYPVEIFIQFSAFYSEKGAALLSLPLVFVTLAMVTLQKGHMKGRSYVQLSGGTGQHALFSLGRWGILATAFCTTLAVLSAILPVIVLLKTAGPLSIYVQAIGSSWGQIHYSFITALASALVATVLGFLLGYMVVRGHRASSSMLSFALFLPLAVPAMTTGIGMIKIWNHPAASFVFESSLAVVMGCVARFIPYSAITASSGLRQVSTSMEEAAFLVSASWVRVAGKVLCPAMKRSLLTAFFIVFILSFGELGTTLLLIPPGRETLTIKIYNLMHYGAEQTVAALCVVVVSIILTLAGLYAIIQRLITVRE